MGNQDTHSNPYEIKTRQKQSIQNNDNASIFDKNPSSLTLQDLAKLVIFKYGSIQNFSSELGISRGRGYQILKGIDKPRKPSTIKKIANVLEIDPVILAQLFSRVISEPKEEEKEKNGESELIEEN